MTGSAEGALDAPALDAPALDALWQEVRGCTLCAEHLPRGPRPVLRPSATARLLIVGQAPGTKVHETGVPWNDPSGDRLRDWLGIGRETFYDRRRIAIMPMGFCYPGALPRGGDAPPRPECAPQWHAALLALMPAVELTLLVGQYAQAHYLGDRRSRTLTETVARWRELLPDYLPTPHPSWRTRGWVSRNPWFEAELLPALRSRVAELVGSPLINLKNACSSDPIRTRHVRTEYRKSIPPPAHPPHGRWRRRPYNPCPGTIPGSRGPQAAETDTMTEKGDVRKVVLAYSGGLDTSVILRWLQDTYRCEVVTFTADLGQGEELEPARRKAEMLGIREIYIEDLREEFTRDYVFPMFRANAVYEGTYLLGTSIARPLIAKRQIEIANETGADAVAHGATGKGNDQVRFELSYLALKPDIRIIAPWREWDLTSRTRLVDYAEKHQIPVPRDKRGEPPFSQDANLLHISSEGKMLEDPWQAADYDLILTRMVSPMDAPDRPTEITIDFEQGDPTAIDGEAMSPAALLTRLNELGGENGVGALDIVENRFIGMKSRGVYETPGGTILLHARRAMESITLERGAAHLKDELMPRYAELVYNGFWFAPEREMLQAAIDHASQRVSGTVRLKLYKGNVMVTGRKSPNSLYDEAIVTFEEDAGAYDQRDAEGFIRLNALRLQLLGRQSGALGRMSAARPSIRRLRGYSG